MNAIRGLCAHRALSAERVSKLHSVAHDPKAIQKAIRRPSEGSTYIDAVAPASYDDAWLERGFTTLQQGTEATHDQHDHAARQPELGRER